MLIGSNKTTKLDLYRLHVPFSPTLTLILGFFKTQSEDHLWYLFHEHASLASSALLGNTSCSNHSPFGHLEHFPINHNY